MSVLSWTKCVQSKSYVELCSFVVVVVVVFFFSSAVFLLPQLIAVILLECAESKGLYFYSTENGNHCIIFVPRKLFFAF